jgi:hypothetical protein
MRVVILAVAAAGLALSGCSGGGGKAALVEACMKDDQEKKTCECMADEFEQTLDKDVFNAMVLGAQGKEAEAEKIMNELPMEKQFSIAPAAMGAMMKCGMAGATG